MAIPRFQCTEMSVFRQSADAGTIIMGSTESVLTQSHWPIDFS